MKDAHEHSLLSRFAVFSAKNGKPEVIAKAESEFETYRAREMRQLKSDFDEAVREYLP